MAQALRSRRFQHPRTGEAAPAYVVNGYVIEKNWREWDARPYRGAAGNGSNANPKSWWEVRTQGTRVQPGVSIEAQPLHTARRLRDAKEWAWAN